MPPALQIRSGTVLRSQFAAFSVRVFRWRLFPPPVNPYRGASLPLFECETADLVTRACPSKQGSSLGLNGTHCPFQNISAAWVTASNFWT